MKRGKPKLPRPLSKAEELLALQLRAEGIAFLREMPVCPERRWRLDFVIMCAGLRTNIAVEINGWGRHQRFTGYEADMEKFCEAVCHGWRLLTVTPRHVSSGQALAWIKRLIG